MSLPSERLLTICCGCGLSHLPNCYEAIAEGASAKNLPYLDFLRTDPRSREPRQACAPGPAEDAVGALPYNKGLDHFDFAFQPSVDERKLASFAFLERKENVLLLGPPGVGPSCPLNLLRQQLPSTNPSQRSWKIASKCFRSPELAASSPYFRQSFYKG